MSCFDNKRYVLDDGIRTLAYLHKDSVASCQEIQKYCGKKDCDKKYYNKKDYNKEDYDNWKRLWLKQIRACNKMTLVVM